METPDPTVPAKDGKFPAGNLASHQPLRLLKFHISHTTYRTIVRPGYSIFHSPLSRIGGLAGRSDVRENP